MLLQVWDGTYSNTSLTWNPAKKDLPKTKLLATLVGRTKGIVLCNCRKKISSLIPDTHFIREFKTAENLLACGGAIKQMQTCLKMQSTRLRTCGYVCTYV